MSISFFKKHLYNFSILEQKNNLGSNYQFLIAAGRVNSSDSKTILTILEFE
jgi:hypothetical protein